MTAKPKSKTVCNRGNEKHAKLQKHDSCSTKKNVVMILEAKSKRSKDKE